MRKATDEYFSELGVNILRDFFLVELCIWAHLRRVSIRYWIMRLVWVGELRMLVYRLLIFSPLSLTHRGTAVHQTLKWYVSRIRGLLGSLIHICLPKRINLQIILWGMWMRQLRRWILTSKDGSSWWGSLQCHIVLEFYICIIQI